MNQKGFLISLGVFASTYIINAIFAPLYSNNCVKILSYNSPFCISSLSLLALTSYVNGWLFYITLTTGALFIIAKTIGK